MSAKVTQAVSRIDRRESVELEGTTDTPNEAQRQQGSVGSEFFL